MRACSAWQATALILVFLLAGAAAAPCPHLVRKQAKRADTTDTPFSSPCLAFPSFRLNWPSSSFSSQRELNRAAGKFVPGSAEKSSDATSLHYIYPYGATMTVRPPSVPVLSSGNVSIPLNRPTCAFFSDEVRCRVRRGTRRSQGAGKEGGGARALGTLVFLFAPVMQGPSQHAQPLSFSLSSTGPAVQAGKTGGHGLVPPL